MSENNKIVVENKEATSGRISSQGGLAQVPHVTPGCDMQPIHTITIGKQRLEIHLDDVNANNPREWSNLGKMIMFHRRYIFPCELDVGSFNSWQELEEKLYKDFDAVVVLPIFMYDHGDISISTSCAYPYNDRWDAGQVGFIVATREQVIKEYGRKRITKKLRACVQHILVGEVSAYDQYLRGEVYGYVLKKLYAHGGEEHLDSCWGFYGKVEDMAYHLPKRFAKKLRAREFDR